MAEHPMDTPQYGYPVIQVVCIDGEPIWQITGYGLCVHEHCGQRAWDVFRAQCRSRGLPVPE
jgi:hypothetical protein